MSAATNDATAAAGAPIRQTWLRRNGHLLLLAPGFVWMLLFLVAPLAMMVYVSFWTQKTFSIEPDFTLASWRTFFSSETYFATLLTTIRIWLIVLAVSMVTYAISFVLIRTISRYREYGADRGSALLTGAPEYLMSALQKISSQMTQIPRRDLREMEGMSAFFIIPTRVKRATGEWLMDHPPLEKRLARLAEIAREMGRPVA